MPALAAIRSSPWSMSRGDGFPLLVLEPDRFEVAAGGAKGIAGRDGHGESSGGLVEAGAEAYVNGWEVSIVRHPARAP